VSPLVRFFLLVGATWLAAWLPIGLWTGDFDYVLTPVSRGSGERQLYQGLFYTGLLLAFVDCWRRCAPSRPKWGRPILFALYFVQGLVASLILRGVLYGSGLASWAVADLTWWRALEIAISCLAVALVEEAIFRGFLLGTIVERLGWSKGVVLTSLLFAIVHLFRPGGLTFKLCYGLGLFGVGFLLSCIAWRHNSILASAGFHGGLIVLNLSTQAVFFRPSLWSGYQLEPVSGLLSLLLTMAFYGLWTRLVPVSEPSVCAPGPDDASPLSEG